VKTDVLIVGAGFAGMVMAERISNELGKRCLVIDRRSHIGGNANDYIDDAGVLVHRYGPHLFHTNSDKIFEYLSRFTEWNPTIYNAKSFTDGKFWSFPINLQTFEEMIGRTSNSEEMENYLAKRRVNVENPKNSEEAIISQVGWELYEKFYKGYTQKQWRMHPRELDASVCTRIPIRTTRNDLYFNDKHQAMPKLGYTTMFENMLNSRITTVFNTDYRLLDVEAQHTVYTGPIDEYFNYVHGPLPYRSLRFEFETFKQEFWQPTFMVSYPNSEEFTRIVEIKHVTGQKSDYTTIVREYPEDYVVGKEAYYPIPAPDAALAYAKYKAMAEHCKDVTFVGRLARYVYINMDQTVGMALSEFEKLRRIL
jgi:UDP-galactopyranose mutase